MKGRIARNLPLRVAVVLLLASGASQATPIEYSLVTVTDDAFGSLAPGSPITITFAYEDSQPGLVFGNSASYDLLSLSLSAGGETATFLGPIPASGTLAILDASSPAEDDRLTLVAIVGATFASSTGTLGGVAPQVLQIDLLDATDGVFSNLALPDEALTAADFTSLVGTLDGGVPHQTVLSTVTSLSGTVVPEPSSGVLLGVGLLGVGVSRRPSSRKVRRSLFLRSRDFHSTQDTET